MKPRSLVVVILLFLVLLVASKSVFIVNQTERAVMLRFGEIVNDDVQPGLHFKIPFVNTVLADALVESSGRWTRVPSRS